MWYMKHWSRKETEYLHRPFAASWSRWECQEINYYGWWDVGLCVQCQSKALVVFTAEVRTFPRPGKSTAEDTVYEGHACLLQLLKCVCAMSSVVGVKQWTSLSVWHHLQEPVWKKQVKLWQKDSWYLHHSIVPLHTLIILHPEVSHKKQNSIGYTANLHLSNKLYMFPKS